MKISCIRYYKDENSFNILKTFGIKVKEIQETEKIDQEIENLIKSDYRTIMITNELAGFSEDIMKKYNNSNNINIIIMKNKTKKKE